MTTLTHFSEDGRPVMVDVTDKAVTRRQAVAEGAVVMAPETLDRLKAGTAKGDVASVAILAGIIGGKKTSDLIPLCHPLPLTKLDLRIEPDEALPGVRITATAVTDGKTGVEMEALTAVTVAGLTVYDMLKAADRGMTIGGVRLVSKSGGRSGDWRRD
ncbi:cyclic pyranopterin monophosphate synthase MoaC [Parvularcula dongshanensis]|uniref:Cyclic pyranopterin monophosphate synthase n=1 Tax=Parvularcula dongshanensis TaxID=1173995 RepID=A0A840I5N0_9PROT|nr:cyclic pyranopterin phosphate synthase [Parvularcula dongshanensis]